jgi:hypothetical protein
METDPVRRLPAESARSIPLRNGGAQGRTGAAEAQQTLAARRGIATALSIYTRGGSLERRRHCRRIRAEVSLPRRRESRTPRRHRIGAPAPIQPADCRRRVPSKSLAPPAPPARRFPHPTGNGRSSRKEWSTRLRRCPTESRGLTSR